MFTAAIIIYVTVSFLIGPIWPLDLLGGKAGFIGRLLAIGWIALLLGGL